MRKKYREKARVPKEMLETSKRLTTLSIANLLQIMEVKVLESVKIKKARKWKRKKKWLL